MLKNLLLSCFAVSLLTPALAQHKRRVLIEEFTNASCPPCASQNPAFNAVLEANSEYVTPIKYQTNWPGYDPMNVQTQTEVQPRVSYYGVTGVPNGRQNGTLEVFPMTSYNATTIQTAYNTLTPVTMNLSHGFTADYDSILLSVSVTSDEALTGTLRLRVGITEEGIYFDEAPGTNGETEFFNVMRKMLPNSGGTNTGDFAAGETKTYQLAWALKNIYDLNQLGAVAWLQNDATKEVFQSARSFPIGGITPVNVKIAPKSELNCTAGAIPTFQITNTATSALTTATFRYRVGNGPWSDFLWTGNVGPGATAEVALTDVVFNATSTTKIEIEAVQSNNGFQTSQIGATVTLNFRTQLDPGSAVPFINDFQTGNVPGPGWTVFNPDPEGWKLVTNAGSGSTRSSRCGMYNIPKGTESAMITPPIDLNTSGGVFKLKFDHAYTYYKSGLINLFDSLRVQVSTDCGGSWNTVFKNGFIGLATAPPSTTSFLPTADQWRSNEVDITPFAGNTVFIRFLAKSGDGNNLFIDNVNVEFLVGAKELALDAFSLQPNPAREWSNVQFSLTKPESIRLLVFDAIGSLVQSQELGDLTAGAHTVKLDASRFHSGTYRVVLQGREGVAHTQWIVIK